MMHITYKENLSIGKWNQEAEYLKDLLELLWCLWANVCIISYKSTPDMGIAVQTSERDIGVSFNY